MKRLPQLDGIRGIAILVVILHNQVAITASLPLSWVFANGWMGVDLFFVLSGFLITGMLLDTKHSGGYFRNFYARRCLRIWPLYFSLLVFMFAIVPVFLKAGREMVFERASPWWAYPLFLQNLLVAAPTSSVGPLGVTWSLAIEEQFYVVWPWLVRFVSNRVIARIALAVICLSPLLRLVLETRILLYSNTFSRLDGLMAGALLAVISRESGFKPARFIRPAWVVLATALPAAFVLQSLNEHWIVFSLSAAASAALVFLALYSEQRYLQTVLRNRFIVYTGTISYGLYLLHKLPFDMAKELPFHFPPFIMVPALIAAGYGVAALSWNLLEKPFLKLKHKFEPKSERELAAATMTGSR